MGGRVHYNLIRYVITADFFFFFFLWALIRESLNVNFNPGLNMPPIEILPN